MTHVEELENELRKTRERVEAVTQEFEAFSYSVSHDLRAPLRAVDGFSRALLEDCSAQLDDVGKDHIARIRSGAKKMEQLIEALLSLSRVSRDEVIQDRVDLSAIAGSIVDQLRESEPQRTVQMVIPDGLVAYSDARLTTLMLESLIKNAWKFTRNRADAKIEMGMSEDAETQTYFIRDNGVGFDMTQIHRLFSPFRRLHAESEFEGIGIGLALVKRVAGRLGGRVWAESKVSAGATFHFTLPRQALGK